MKWLYGKCESLILWGVGLAILWLALSPQYNLFCEPPHLKGPHPTRPPLAYAKLLNYMIYCLTTAFGT